MDEEVAAGHGQPFTTPSTLDPGRADATLGRLLEVNRASFDADLPPPGRSRQRLQALEAALALSEAQCEQLAARVAALEASTSWRLSAPARWLGDALRRRRPAETPGPLAPPRPSASGLSYSAWIATAEPAMRAALRPPADAVLPDLPVLRLDPGQALGPDLLGDCDSEFVGVMDGRDRLAADAVAIVRYALRDRHSVDALFADEDVLGPDGGRQDPFFKPGWDPELQAAGDLFGAFAVCRTSLLRRALEQPGSDRRAVWARVAAACRPGAIRHVPAVLCHCISPRPEWRAVAYKLPQPPPPVSLILAAEGSGHDLLAVAERWLAATDYPALEVIVAGPAVASRAPGLDTRVRLAPVPADWRWTRRVNAAARQARGTVLVLADPSLAPRDPAWLGPLVAHACRPDVGAVAAKLVQPDGRPAGTGFSVGGDGTPRRLLPTAVPDLPRSVWAAGGVGLAVRSAVFLDAGGFDDDFSPALGGIEFCLRVAARGYRCARTPFSVVEQARPADAADWQAGWERVVRDWGALALHDPYLNRNLHIVDGEPVLRGTEASEKTVYASPPAAPPADVGPAQARRDRLRLGALQQEVLRLRAELALASRQPLRHLGRRALRRLPQPAQRLARRVWRGTVPPDAVESTGIAPVPAGRGRALVIDHHWPQPDRDSGSVDIVNLLDSLTALGFETSFLAAEEFAQTGAARTRLAERGVRCPGRADAVSAVAWVEAHGAAFDLVVLCRVFCGGAFLEQVQRVCGKARLVFNSIDLNFLREERRAQVTGDRRLLAQAVDLRAREEHVIRACDATMVVSAAEADLLAAAIPDAYAVQMPLARPVQRPQASFAQRGGIGFIGGFAHAPNVDAVRYFLAEIWPPLLALLPQARLEVVGAGMPADLLAGAPGAVCALGHVPDVGPWFDSLRLTVAPLRFGAGAKGKIASSLAAGVPCVASPVAAEGMALGTESGVLVAETPTAFAARIRDLHQDPDLWQSLSRGALDYAERQLSLDAWRGRLDAMLVRIGL